MSEQPQDVFKDAGEEVQFTYLQFKRKDQKAEQEAIADFADTVQAIARSMRIRAAEDDLRIAVGFSRAGWDWLFPDGPRPKELESYETLSNPNDERAVMPVGIGKDADMFIHVRAARTAVVYEVMSQIRTFLKDVANVLDETKGFRYFEGRAIIGFIDGTENPEGDEAYDWSVVGDEDSTFAGGSYAFAQKWIHDMDYWNGLATEEQERAIGRRKFSDLELDEDEKAPNAHNESSKNEVDGEEQKIVRMNVPFSDPAEGVTGTYFIGYARHWDVTKGMLKNMVEKSDYLLTFSKVQFGQLFFIPSKALLDQIADGEFGK